MIETGWHWRISVAINRALGGRKGQPMCSRAWQNDWRLFIECMAIAFRDVVHCETIHLRWLATQEPPALSGKGRPRAGY